MIVDEARPSVCGVDPTFPKTRHGRHRNSWRTVTTAANGHKHAGAVTFVAEESVLLLP